MVCHPSEDTFCATGEGIKYGNVLVKYDGIEVCNQLDEKYSIFHQWDRTEIAEKIEKGERASSLMGNLYTASIFLSLILTFIVAILWHTSGTRALLCQICATRLSKRYKNTQFTFQHETPLTC